MNQADLVRTALAALRAIDPSQMRETEAVLSLLEEARQEFYRIEDALNAALPNHNLAKAEPRPRRKPPTNPQESK